MAFDRHRPPADDGSPARVIVTMVGIVGILLLGSLFWSALGAMFGALGQATQAVPPLTRPVQTAVVAQPIATATLELATPTATLAATAVPGVEMTATPNVQPTNVPTLEATAAPTVLASGRSPWILLPQPAPGARVNPGGIVLEARGRGDLPIADIRLELDGAALPVSLEQRSDSIWRGTAATQVAAGRHTARAVVIDQAGRSGAYRWSFDVGP